MYTESIVKLSSSAASHQRIVDKKVKDFNDGESAAADQQPKVSANVTCE